MKTKRNVELPDFNRTRTGNIVTPYVRELFDFLDSDDISLLFECEDRKEADRIRATLGSRIINNKLPLNIFLRGTDVYVTRKAVE